MKSVIIAALGGIAQFGAAIASAAPKKGIIPEAGTGFDAEIARNT